ncbi:TetR/AcrR family transcriptional regulator [Amycolatopsis taiwanensis]|uniref:TetR family transcriptional regulator n=1 Tax=Amycolatopsis taiwanensis TaxID=342230 RepID=A0A9W6VB74_9PSEU|nr:TetR/AcrR family transcriptional regulator [Amycolatopsis taiwanensis]GLY64643.1 TetR family transcriptional regulator [Amycolatopsis taiwanensis]
MGHRENLLSAARECLLRTGYARTTVRELVAASGANQASINYHFGSKEELLTQALHELNTEWGELLFAVLDDPATPAGTDTPATHEARWSRIIESIRANRELWFVNFEGISYLKHDEKVRAMNAGAQQTARTVLARAFGGLGPEAAPDEVRAVGAHYYSLLVGTALQWLTDPEHAPTAAEIVRADQRTAK